MYTFFWVHPTNEKQGWTSKPSSISVNRIPCAIRLRWIHRAFIGYVIKLTVPVKHDQYMLFLIKGSVRKQCLPILLTSTWLVDCFTDFNWHHSRHWTPLNVKPPWFLCEMAMKDGFLSPHIQLLQATSTCQIGPGSVGGHTQRSRCCTPFTFTD